MGTDIGFIGVGAIASALVTGFCSEGDLDHRIFLSPRNAERAAELARKFQNVTVAGSNQEVLDRSEWIILAVVPKFGEDIIRPLSFRGDHRVVNLMSSRKLPEIADWIGKTRTLIHMIPLPFSAYRIGPIAIYPNDRDAAALFTPLGEIIGLEDVKRIEVISAITALLSPYYTVLWEIVKWCETEGLSRKETTDYTAAFFKAASFQARCTEDDGLRRLAEEMTPGGLNEMAMSSIKEQGGFEPWVKALELVLARLRQ